MGLPRPFSSRRMWSVSSGLDGVLGEAEETALFLPVMGQAFARRSSWAGVRITTLSWEAAPTPVVQAVNKS
jgi:hypothetical protein